MAYRRTKPPESREARAYSELWRVVDGMTADAFKMHPEYLAKGISERTVRNSINKRVVGGILGYASQRGAVPVTGG